MVNKEVLPEKKIADIPSGYAPVAGQHDEIKEMMKPIPPPALNKPPSQEDVHEILKRIDPPVPIKDDIREENSDDDDDETYMDTDVDEDSDEDPSSLHVDDVSEHLIPVHGYKGGVSDMNTMIKATGKDLVSVKCDRIEKLLTNLKLDLAGTDYENVVQRLTTLIHGYCSGIPLGENVLKNELRLLERSPAKKSLLTEISSLTNDISDELYRVREIFTRLSNIEYKHLTTELNRIESNGKGKTDWW